MGDPRPAEPGLPHVDQAAIPWSARLAVAAFGFVAMVTVSAGLFMFAASVLGGGVSWGSDDVSTGLGLVAGLLFGVFGCGMWYLARAVLRGRLMPSVISVCVAPALVGLGIWRLLFAHTSAGIGERLTGVVAPLVLLVSLASPSHRRYIGRERAQRAPQWTPDGTGSEKAANRLSPGANG